MSADGARAIVREGPRAAIRLEDLTATRHLAQRLAPLLHAGDLVAIEGDLGTGKSELARSLIRARAGSPIEVPSPTFTLLQHYDLPGLHLVHADLYRLRAPSDLLELGLDELLEEAALIVEWAGHAGDLLPSVRLRLRLEIEAGEARRLTIEAPGRYAAWLPDLLR